MSNILIVDDDPDVCQVLSRAVQDSGYLSVNADSLQSARSQAGRSEFQAVFLDLELPDGNGLEILSYLQDLPSSPEVIIITGKGDPEGAELALSQGAFDFLEKPASILEITRTLARALEYRDARIKRSRQSLLKCPDIVGSSPAMTKSLQDLAQAAASDHNFMIYGETGTGKELFARALHQNSPRARENFVVVDCSALSPSLLESTLFGHVKGAFTGAVENFAGLIARSHKGTLFLDEIGELTPEMQKRFLRLLEEKRYLPVGASQEMTSEFRLVCATNRDLESMVQCGKFRADLLYRIRMQKCRLPPLRERKQDIPELIRYFLNQIGKDSGENPKEVYPEVLESFQAYHWPGNVRELKNALEQAVAAAGEEPMLHRKHLPLHLRVAILKCSLPELNRLEESRPPGIQPGLDREPERDEILHALFSPLGGESIPDWKSFKEQVLREAERRYFQDLYTLARGKVKEMAKLSGVSQSRVYEIIKRCKHKEK